MSTIKVNVKWGKQKLSDVEVDLDEPGLVFKAQLFALTGVAPERQKVMVKGGTLKDEADLKTLNLKPGQTLMMMGTVGELLQAPTQATKFVEDMSEKELAIATKEPSGLENLGNSCYMNASLQCLRKIEPLRHAISQFKGALSFDQESNLVWALRDLLRDMERGGSVQPLRFFGMLHSLHPPFAEMGNGGLQQQDAQECFNLFLRTLSSRLPALFPGGTNVVEEFMTGRFATERVCDEEGSDEREVTSETFNMLSCHISVEVNHLLAGLRNGLDEKITKHSAVLDRDAVFVRQSRISRLPAFLTVQEVRFCWKGNVSAKILRDVKYGAVLDTYTLCTPELQAKLVPMRDRFKAYDDAQLILAQRAKGLRKGKGAAPMETDESTESSLYSFGNENETNKTPPPYSFEDDIGSNNSGLYELTAVLTHKGRSSNSGHYVGWARNKGDHWLKYDDDTVSNATTDDVLRLSGGGDWHIAYLLMYAPRQLPSDEADVLERAAIIEKELEAEKARLEAEEAAAKNTNAKRVI